MKDRDFRKAADAIVKETEGLLAETLQHVESIERRQLRRKKTAEQAVANLLDLATAAGSLDKVRRSYQRVALRMVP